MVSYERGTPVLIHFQGFVKGNSSTPCYKSCTRILDKTRKWFFMSRFRVVKSNSGLRCHQGAAALGGGGKSSFSIAVICTTSRRNLRASGTQACGALRHLLHNCNANTPTTSPQRKGKSSFSVALICTISRRNLRAGGAQACGALRHLLHNCDANKRRLVERAGIEAVNPKPLNLKPKTLNNALQIQTPRPETQTRNPKPQILSPNQTPKTKH